jgi:hypothetical protein
VACASQGVAASRGGAVLASTTSARRDSKLRSFEIKVVCADVFDADGFRRLAEAGVTDCITVPWSLYGGDVRDLAVKTAARRRFGEEIIARSQRP